MALMVKPAEICLSDEKLRCGLCGQRLPDDRPLCTVEAWARMSLGQFRVSELAEYWIVSCKQCRQQWSVNRRTTGSAATAPERFQRDAGERATAQMVEHADSHKPRVLHEVDDPPASRR
jgi:hypothetical protein